MESQVGHKRKYYLIDKRFQLNFIFKFYALLICVSVISGALIYYSNLESTTVTFENLKVVVKPTADFILPMLFEILLMVTLLAGIATIAVTMFASHKIVGPLYRLKMELEKMKSGDLSYAFHIRSKDQLQALATDFDEMRAKLNKSFGALKGNWALVKNHLNGLLKHVENEEEKKKVKDSIKKIDSELSRVKTGQ